MRKIFYSLIALSTLFISCEDPIDVELMDAETLLVVDAFLNNVDSVQVIKITNSQAFFDNTFATGIENAEVILTRDDGEVFDFIHTTDGEYEYNFGPDVNIGEVGSSFTLNINLNDQQYAATTVLNRTAPIDSIRQEFRDDEIFAEDGIYCELISRDPQGIGDTYWIKTYKNGLFLNRATEINLAFDAGFDSGGEIDGFVFITPIRELINELGDDQIPVPWIPGEEIRVEIHSLTVDNFFFMETLRDQLINSQSGIFAEPLTNTDGNIVHLNGSDTVLGTFNVASVSSITYIIQ